MIKNYIRALRLPFVTASILPFVFGSLIEKYYFTWGSFLLGLVAAVSTHLGANLINDYADSKSGVDSKDKTFYGFFGGSKLIQEGVFSAKFYLMHSIIYFCLALFCVIILAFILKSVLPICCFLVICFLGFTYSHKPFQFAYNYLGEIIIFLLFGPALVMGGYYIQTGIFPDIKSFLLSVPFGLMIMAILFANEVPDYNEDCAARKFNWVRMCGPKNAHWVYSTITSLTIYFIILNVFLGYLNFLVLAVIFLYFLPAKAALILKKEYANKVALVQSSKLTIAFQNVSGLILILSLLF